MLSLRKNKKGMALLFVLTMVIIVCLLATIIMGLIRSSYNLNMHELARIQAHYAGIGALNVALDRLRRGQYVVDTDCILPNGCSVLGELYPSGDFSPATISAVTVYILSQNTTGINGVIPDCPPSSGNNNAACVSVRVEYTKF